MTNDEFGKEITEGRIELSELSKSAIMQGFYFSIGFLTSSASSEEYFSPLGIAFSSGVHRKYTLFSCFGAMAGYIVSNDYIHAFRYVMALILVYILKVYVNTFPNLQKKTYIPALISLFATISTGIVVMATEPFGLRSVLMRVAEAVISFGAAYFFCISAKTTEKIGENERITSKEVISLVVAALALILCLSRISLFGISLSGIACSYIVMIASYLFKESGGAVIGTGASLGFTMTGNSLPTVFCYAGAGLFSGLFSYSGRVLCACAYIFSYGALHLFLSEGNRSFLPLIETAIASFFFVITPQSFVIKLKTFFSFSLFSNRDRELYNLVVSKIKTIRNGICDMSGTVSKVSHFLKEKSVPDTTMVYLRVRDNVCSDCGSYMKCWKSQMSATLGEFDCVMEEIRKNGIVTPSGAPLSLQSKCIRIMSLCDNFNKNYASYSARIGTEGRINEMRKITADQFDTVCQMLDDLLDGFENGTKPVGEKSLAIKNSLDDMGVASAVTCYEDNVGNLFVNINTNADCKATEKEIFDCLEKVTERDFAKPVIVNTVKEKLLMFYEKPEYAVQCDFFQISSRKDESCGDCFESFYDGKGNFIAVLSDGMGRGNRAAVDSTMATSLFSRLIVSGFSFPCALRLVNSAMLIKGHEESLATLDILKVNLYNGHSVLYKAGASASLLLRNGKVGEIKKSALPIGLLRQAEFATAQGNLKDEDIIVLMSDGATENSMVELKEYIAKNGYSEDLSEKLCAIARGRNVGHSDDITIATIKIKNGD